VKNPLSGIRYKCIALVFGSEGDKSFGDLPKVNFEFYDGKYDHRSFDKKFAPNSWEYGCCTVEKTPCALAGIKNVRNPRFVVDLPLDEIKQRIDAHLEILSGSFLLPVKGSIHWFSDKPGSDVDPLDNGVHIQRRLSASLLLDPMPDKKTIVIAPRNYPHRDQMEFAGCRVYIVVEEQNGRCFVAIIRTWKYLMRNSFGEMGIPLPGRSVKWAGPPDNVDEIDPDFELVKAVVRGAKVFLVDANDYMRRHVDPDWIEKVPLEAQ
jgi:hypothetical protein